MPRVLDANEWQDIEKGLRQRVTALNLFIDDIYNEQNILNDGVVPKELILEADTYRPEMQGFSPMHKAWCHISGVDLVRNDDGKVYVLEDNLRCPSGVSYVLENREVMKRSFAKVFEGVSIAPIEEYPEQLLQTLLRVRRSKRKTLKQLCSRQASITRHTLSTRSWRSKWVLS